MTVLLMIPTPVTATIFYFVRQGRRTYSVYSGIRNTLQFRGLSISRSVRLMDYRNQCFYCTTNPCSTQNWLRQHRDNLASRELASSVIAVSRTTGWELVAPATKILNLRLVD